MEYELILCVINKGFAEQVMDSATEAGARGGTVLNARGTAREEAEKFFNISINPEKEIVMIIVDKTIKEDILKNIYENCGLDTPGQGIIFSVPVEDVLGLNPIDLTKEEIEDEE